MMNALRSLWLMIATLLVLNALLLIGGGLWLWSSGRLNKYRVQRLVELFKPTVAQEKQAELEAQAKAKEEAEKQSQARWLEQVAEGPATLTERLKVDEQVREVATQRAERLSREIADLRRRLESDTQLLSKQRAEIDQKRKELDDLMQREQKLRADEDFQQTVAMYEKLPARQAKQMLQNLLQQNKKSQVVEYLAAMQQRKAAGVLKEFKSPQEVAQASELLQMLRMRGVDPTSQSSNSQQNKAPT